jgi:hypothetical protein
MPTSKGYISSKAAHSNRHTYSQALGGELDMHYFLLSGENRSNVPGVEGRLLRCFPKTL